MINKIEKNTTKKNETEKAVVNESLNNEKNYAKVFLKSIRVSPTKLNLVLSAIRGLDAEQAINYLTFSNKRISIQVKKALQSAIANAENNHQLDVDKLYISEATVGRDIVMKRFRPRARGRGAKIMKPLSNLTIKLQEKVEIKEKNTKVKNEKNIKNTTTKEENK